MRAVDLEHLAFVAEDELPEAAGEAHQTPNLVEDDEAGDERQCAQQHSRPLHRGNGLVGVLVDRLVARLAGEDKQHQPRHVERRYDHAR